MAQAVEAHAWRKPSVKLCFGFRIDTRGGSRNRPRECGIVERLGEPRRLHCASIA